MPSARYWRIKGIETYLGDDLELNEVALYEQGLRVDANAVITSNIAPVSGSLDALKDGGFASSVRWDGPDAFKPGFEIRWDLGVPRDLNKVGVAGPSQELFLHKYAIESSSDGVSWTYVTGTSPASKWRGPASFYDLRIETGDEFYNSVVLTLHGDAGQGDPFFSNVSLLLNGNGTNGSTTIVDSSASAKTVTAVGNAQISTAQSKFGGASLLFDGTGDYLTIPQSADFAFGTGDFTVEMWFYPTAVNRWHALFYTGAYETGQFSIRITDTNFLQTYINNGANSYGIVTGTTPLAVNTWYHIAVSSSGGTIRTYLNGVQETSANNSISIANSGVAYFGTQVVSGVPSLFPQGYVDDLRVTKGVARYTQAFTPPAKELPGTRSFIDTSPSPKTVTAVGGARIDTSVSVFGGGSMFFDGTGDYISTPYTANFDWWTNDFTIEAWVYATSWSTWSYSDGVNLPVMVSNGDPVGNTNYWSFGPTATGALRFYYFNGVAGQHAMLTTAVVATNAWSHIAMVKSSSGVTLYINGVSGGTFTIQGTPVTSATVPLVIGQVNNRCLNGYIDDLRITKGVARYTQAFTPSAFPHSDFLKAVVGDEFYNSVALLLDGDYPTTDEHFDNVSLLISGDGTNGSTAIFDRSKTPKAVTVNGNAQISTAQSKFGGSSLLFDGTGDYLTVPAGTTELSFGSGDFTMEAWVYPLSLSGTKYLVVGQSDLGTVSGSSFAFALNGTTCDIYVGSTAFTTTAPVPSVGAWSHVAMVRSGGTLLTFLNGAIVGSNTSVSGSVNVGSTAYPNSIGALATGASSWHGHIDDLRITKGVARYTQAFTPPTAAFKGAFEDYSPTPKIVRPVGNAALDAVTKKFGTGAMYFDGSGDYLLAGTGANWKFLHDGSTWTAEGWFRFNSFSSSPMLFATTTTTVQHGMCAYVNASRQVQVQIYRNVSSSYVIEGTSTGTVPDDGQFHHIAICFDHTLASANCLVFIDGVQAGTFNKTGNAPSTSDASNPLGIGVSPNSLGFNQLNGYVDDFRITSGMRRYTQTFTPTSQAFAKQGLSIDPQAANVSLLLRMDGANGSTTFTDESLAAKTVTRFGNAQISTAQSQYGGSSAYFDGSGDYLTVSDATAFDLPGDFTVEFWMYPQTFAPVGGTSNRCPLSLASSSTGIANAAPAFLLGATGFSNPGQIILFGASNIILGATVVTLNAWSHVALVRSGTTLTLYLNGVSDGSTTFATAIDTDQLLIGRSSNAGGDFQGYVDDVRITKGVARYTGSFTPTIYPPLVGESDGTDPYANNVSLLLNFNGNFSDISLTPKTVTPLGGAVTSEAQSKYGGRSLALFGTSAVSIPNDAWLQWGNQDFCIEFWVYPTTTGTAQRLFSHGENGGSWWPQNEIFYTITGTIDWVVNNANTNTYQVVSSSGSIPANAWTHLAFSRSGSVFRIFINGVQSGSLTWNMTFTSMPTPAYIGAYLLYGSLSQFFQGYIDDFRITKGVARYTANFTPPSSEMVLGTFDLTPLRLDTKFMRLDINGDPITPVDTAVSLDFFNMDVDVQDGGVGRVVGTVKEKALPANTPLRRKVVLFNYNDHRQIRETWSDAATGNYVFNNVDMNRTYTVVSYDHTGFYRAVIADNLAPERMP